MTQKERLKAKQRLIELFETSPSIVGSATWREYYEQTADHFLDNGVIVPPCKVGDTVQKRVLDPCCGSKMFWFDRENPDVEFCDIELAIIHGCAKNTANLAMTGSLLYEMGFRSVCAV